MSAPGNRFVRYLRRLGAGSMLISIIVHLILAIIATLWVVSTVTPHRKALFQAGNDGADTVQHPVKMSNTQPHLDTLTQRLSVDTSDAAVALPDLPSLPDPATSDAALSSALSGGAGSNSGPIMPAYGFREAQPGAALVGHFYDLKQLKGGRPNPDVRQMLARYRGIDPWDNLVTKEIGPFARNGFQSSYFADKFWQGPGTLYATQVIVPNTPSDKGPALFGAPKVEPRAWIAHYRCRISPPETGTYRFVGGGDDILVVGLDGQLVLDGGIVNTTGFKTDRPDKPAYAYDFSTLSGDAVGNFYLGKRRGGFVVGHSMELRSGLFYNLDIVIGESPGGFCFANLLVEKEGATYQRDAHDNPILPAFRIADVKLPIGSLPPIQPDGPIWRALPPR